MSLAAPSDFVTEYSLGIHHSVFLHASGHVSFRGSNRKNQTQGLDGCRNIRDIKCTWNGSYMFTTHDPPHILSTGSNSHGQLGRAEDSSNWKVQVPTDEGRKTIRVLACGSEHSLVCLTDEQGDDEVWGWGWNEHGNLGVGHTLDSPTPLKMWPPPQPPENVELHPVRNIWGGTGSSWILVRIKNSLIHDQQPFLHNSTARPSTLVEPGLTAVRSSSHSHPLHTSHGRRSQFVLFDKELRLGRAVCRDADIHRGPPILHADPILQLCHHLVGQGSLIRISFSASRHPPLDIVCAAPLRISRREIG